MPELQSLGNLTGSTLSQQECREALLHFAREQGWHPSDEILAYRGTEEFCNGHLLVEHGLSNTAVITFLQSPHTFAHLPYQKQNLLLSISYNNLVDWHFFPDDQGLLSVYNRTKPIKPKYISLAETPDAWRAEAFDQIVGRRPNPNLPALDSALIRTVSRWKRILASELHLANNTAPISELFNAIFFVRALEDDRRKTTGDDDRILLRHMHLQQGNNPTLESVMRGALDELTAEELPEGLLDQQSLRVFDQLDEETLSELFLNFYDNRFAPYAYDFSLMSKHALSRIYEHYISELKESPDIQKTLFATMPEELHRRDVGEVYTPQYIARFFARFLEDNYTPARFRRLRVADPACGSGMFLRTLLEKQCDPLVPEHLPSAVSTAFPNVFGIDVEENACKATRLSLTLLHVVLTGKFPTHPLQIINDEAIDYVKDHPELCETFDAIIANPPYVKWENIPNEWKPRVAHYLKDYEAGKADLYLAFIRIGLDLVKPGGFLLYVLPHAFLMAQNAKKIREKLANTCWIRFIADLSDIEVFGDTSSYPILLIVEKKSPEKSKPVATIVRCTAFAGRALQDALDGREGEQAFYSVHSAPQEEFASEAWRILKPAEGNLRKLILRFPKLETFFRVRQGIITGCNKVFIRRRDEIPKGEESAYRPFLRDRLMKKYRVPDAIDDFVFYPFADDVPLSDLEIRDRFPATWSYLESHHEELSARKSVNANPELWWRPTRPRTPKKLYCPKIVSPHLVVFPKFSLDAEAQFAVTHSPIITSLGPTDDIPLLKYALAILNSSIGHWQIATQSYKYSRGYARLEPMTVRQFSIPGPAEVPPRQMNRIQNLIDLLIANPLDHEADEELDTLVAGLYGVDLRDLEEIALISDK